MARVTTNGPVLETNIVYLVVDRVKYDDQLPWPPRADGAGPSLQLIDAKQDNSRVSNWGAGPAWLNVTRTGNIGSGTSLLLILPAVGSCFLDDITLIGPGGTNIVRNGGIKMPAVGDSWTNAQMTALAQYAKSRIYKGAATSGG